MKENYSISDETDSELRERQDFVMTVFIIHSDILDAISNNVQQGQLISHLTRNYQISSGFKLKDKYSVVGMSDMLTYSFAEIKMIFSNMIKYQRNNNIKLNADTLGMIRKITINGFLEEENE